MQIARRRIYANRLCSPRQSLLDLRLSVGIGEIRALTYGASDRDTPVSARSARRQDLCRSPHRPSAGCTQKAAPETQRLALPADGNPRAHLQTPDTGARFPNLDSAEGHARAKTKTLSDPAFGNPLPNCMMQARPLVCGGTSSTCAVVSRSTAAFSSSMPRYGIPERNISKPSSL